MDTVSTTSSGVVEVRSFPNAARRRTHFKKMYTESMQVIAVERAKQDQEKATSAEKKAACDKKLEESDPAKLIQEIVQKKEGNASSDEAMREDQFKDHDKVLYEQCKKLSGLLQPKNEASPGKGQGQSYKGNSSSHNAERPGKGPIEKPNGKGTKTWSNKAGKKEDKGGRQHGGKKGGKREY